jgi:hypothetical protein
MCLLLNKNEKQGNAGESQRYQNGINGTDCFDKGSVPGMIKTQGLKCRLESMMQMKTKENHKYNIQYCIKLISEKQSSHLVKIMLANTFRRIYPP